MVKTSFAQFLEREFLRFQYERGKRLTIAEFADILGFSPSAVSLWLNGERTPDKSSVLELARVLSVEIYDYFDLPRPDPDLQTLTYLWPRLTEETRHAIREQAEKYVIENE
jgi:transcriptional regulator with XRE-family HTH domain